MKEIVFPCLLSFMISILYGQADISFVDKTSFAGLGGSLINNGLSLGDYDNDGREDLYVCALNGGPNRLYRNMGNFIFQEVSAAAGVRYTGTSKVSSWADIDNDGDADLYVGNRDEQDLLYINKGNGTFIEEGAARGINNPAPASSILFSDINRDGWLDLYIGNVNSPNKLYLNNGSGYFSDHTQASGATDQAVAMGSVFFDYDLDGDDDLYLTHDAQVPYILYENMGDATFQNISSEANTNYAGFGMGVDVGDYNLDGYMDMYITNLYDNVLYKNNGDGTFENVGAALGVNDPGMGWGNVFADFDNDRLPDIYVVNDTYFSPYNNVLYHNTGSGFEIVSEGDPCESPYGGYATVASDLNDDGLMDLLVANNGAPGVQLFQNKSTGTGHYIGFYLEGVASNRDAVGAKIEIHTPAGVQYDQVIGNSGWAADNGRWIHFGLADQTSVDKVVIKWPSGATEEIDELAADQRYRIKEGEGVVTSSKEVRRVVQSCQMIASDDGLNIHLSTPSDIQALLLSDMAGRSIHVNADITADKAKIDLSALPSGIYQIMVIQSEQTCMSRFWHAGKQ
ncbi:MAG: VCBS repeat-containing protein [Saprospiraceae bacterium]|nr:VCBS repeat-containing protein [Candidatus Opimibacter iunctus]